jgi:hypothetical protein
MLSFLKHTFIGLFLSSSCNAHVYKVLCMVSEYNRVSLCVEVLSEVKLFHIFYSHESKMNKVNLQKKTSQNFT